MKQKCAMEFKTLQEVHLLWRTCIITGVLEQFLSELLFWRKNDFKTVQRTTTHLFKFHFIRVYRRLAFLQKRHDDSFTVNARPTVDVTSSIEPFKSY